MKSHRLSHNTIITGVVLIIAAAALTLDGWAYFQIRNYKPIQATSPVVTTDTMADWQTYTNDTYGYTISYPSNKYISPRSIDTNAIKIQNYNPSPDTFLLSEDEYYIEIDAGRSDCSDNPEWQPTKFGTRNGFVNDKEHADWREAGGRYITACIPGHQQAIFIMITSGDSTFTLQKKILSTFRFVDDISDWQTYTNSQLGFSIKHPAGWKIDDTTTPNKVWFNPRETEAVDSIEVSTKTRNEWLSGFYEDEIVEQRNLVVDGYPAVQIDLDAFGLQETGIFKDGKLYTIVSNQQIKELNILSTFRFTDDVSDSQMYTDTSPLCTAKPVSTEIGSEIYPSDTKYQKLTFLGPIFTAYKCSSSRLNAVLGNSNGQYTLGSTVWLKTAPSQQLITTLKAVGYLCSEKVSDASCKKWRLVKFVNVTDLMKLEPFAGQLEADDCVFCG